MRIISKFHDYYDVIQSYGQDKEIVYVRNYEERDHNIPKELEKLLSSLPYHDGLYSNSNFSAMPFIIIVCTKIHIGYSIKYTGTSCYGSPYEDFYTYDLETIDKIIDKYHKKELKDYYNKEESIQRKYSWRIPFSRLGLKNKFKEYENKKLSVDFHIKENAPILSIQRKLRKSFIYKKNPILRKIQFYKKLQPFEVFQELSMFIGGIVGGAFPPIVELKEKDKIKKHGFDKWSFRKKGKFSR